MGNYRIPRTRSHPAKRSLFRLLTGLVPGHPYWYAIYDEMIWSDLIFNQGEHFESFCGDRDKKQNEGHKHIPTLQRIFHLETPPLALLRSAGRLNHANIVAIHDAGEESDLACIAMELLKSSDLDDYITPSNIMYDPESHTFELADFGIVHITDSSKTRAGTVLGTKNVCPLSSAWAKRSMGEQTSFLRVSYFTSSAPVICHSKVSQWRL